MPVNFDNDRLEQVLKAIVEEYIETAKPVSSKQLTEEHDFGVGSATLRNDMAVLEAEGFVTHPHTSAGRIPTEAGYQYYISHFLNQRPLTKRQRQQIDTAAESPAETSMQTARQLAKAISDLTEEMVVMSIDGEDFFYTGISNMLRKPEFLQERDAMLQASEIFDNIDHVMDRAREQMHNEIEVFIGNKSPVARHVAMIVAEYDQDGHQSVFGILGPMRMDYNTNIAILKYLEQVIHKHHDNER
jgi:heat-inducible transcriptional repressor